MAVAVLNPQPKRDKEERQSSDDPLDKILKAVNIAGTVYNMYDSYSQRAADKLKAQQAEKQKELQTKADLTSKGLQINPEGTGVVEDPSSSVIKTREAQIKRGEEEMSIKREQLALQREQNKLLKGQEGFKVLPKDQQILVEKYAGTKAQLTPIVDQFNQYISQLEDPNISDEQKQQVGRQSLKLMNSPMNPDAVGAEEVKRIGSFLEAAPQPFGPKGWKVGVDIAGFTEAIKNSRDRAAGTLGTVTNQIDALMKRAGNNYVQQEQINRPQQQAQRSNPLQNKANASEMRPPVIQNGVQYNWNPKTQRYE